MPGVCYPSTGNVGVGPSLEPAFHLVEVTWQAVGSVRNPISENSLDALGKMTQ